MNSEERMNVLESKLAELQSTIIGLKAEIDRHIVSADHDARYATKWDVEALDTKLALHKSGSDHDYRYSNRNDVARLIVDNQNLMKSNVYTLTSPNGTKYMLNVSDAGRLELTEL